MYLKIAFPTLLQQFEVYEMTVPICTHMPLVLSDEF